MRTRLFRPVVGSLGLVLSVAVQAQTGPAPGATWQFAGPKNMDTPQLQYFGTRPTSGRVSAVAWSRSNTNIVYCAGGGGGVWKSADGGVTWAVTGTDTNAAWTFDQVDSLAVDPTAENTIYAGSGSWRNLDPSQIHPIGLLKSTDGGSTWTVKTNITQVISKIVVDPDNPQILILVTSTRGTSTDWQGVVLRSTDGGNSWNTPAGLGLADWTDATISGISKTGIRYYYVAGYGAATNAQFFVSTNRGVNWTSLTGGAFPWANPQRDLLVSASQVSPATVYLMSSQSQDVQQSTDGGMTWNSILGGFPATATWGQRFYNRHIEAAWIPGTSVDVVYVGLLTLMSVQSDTGAWTDIALSEQPNTVTHSDQQSLAFNPFNPNQILFGNDGGLFGTIFRPRTRDYGAVSGQPNATLGVTQFYYAGYDPANAANMLGGTQDNSTPRSFGANSPNPPAAPSLNNWNNGIAGDGGHVAIKPVTPMIQFGQRGGSGTPNVFGTTDGWATSNLLLSLGGNSAFTAPFVLDGTGATSNTLFYGTITNTIYLANAFVQRIAWDGVNVAVSNNLGGTNLTAGGGTAYVNAMALAPGDNNRLYTGSSDGAVWATRHALASNTVPAINWQRIDDGALPALPVTWITVDPYNQNRIFVGFESTGTGNNQLWKCEDVTATARNWQNVDHPNPNGLVDSSVNAIALDPADPTNTWYVGMDNGVFYTRDAGTTWIDATHPLGLPAAQVNDVQAIPGTGILNAATFGRGIWTIPLTNGGQQIAGFGISPNPIGSNALNLALGRITLSKPAPPGGVSIQITNDHPSTYNFTNQFIPEGQISTFFFVLGLDHQPGTNVTFTAIIGGESHNTVLQVVDPASGRLAVAQGGPIVATLSFDANQNVNVSFLSEPGTTYVLQYKNALNDPEWIALGPGVTGTGGVLVLQDTSGLQPRRFYRVVGTPGQ